MPPLGPHDIHPTDQVRSDRPVSTSPALRLHDGFGLVERDSFSSTAFAELLDRVTHASLAKATLGLSPASLIGAYLDWAAHLASSPGKRMRLMDKAWRKQLRLQQHAWRCALGMDGHSPCIEPLPQDKRFVSPGWQKWPFNVFYQSHLLMQQWWHVATTEVPGLSVQHERMVSFTARQILDVFSPSNFIFTNPDVLDRTVRENGGNLVRGWQHLIEDWDRLQGNRPPIGAEHFRPGDTVAVTAGRVVFRNDLIELIQYSPTTRDGASRARSRRAGVDYEVLHSRSCAGALTDQVPRRSRVHRLCGLVENPDPSARDMTLDDYRRRGIIESRSDQCDRSGRKSPWGWLLPWRNAACDCGSGAGG